MMIEQCKAMKRYCTFTYLNKPVWFDEFFKNKNYSRVQLHDMTPIGNTGEIVGFCGVAKWENNILSPLDGDCYTPRMRVYGYEEFTLNDEKCLDILVKEW